MTTTFVASNGDTIETRPGGDLVVKSGHDTEWVNPFAVDALREYFQHQRDTELGRWRDPETGLLVYPAGTMTAGTNSEYRAVQVLDETLPYFTLIHEGDLTSKRRRAERKEIEVAARYFAAHPEPKPWMDAAHEEVWEITANGDTGPALATTSNKRGQTLAFRFANGTLVEADSDEITAGRRLYPEEGVYHPVHPDERGDE